MSTALTIRQIVVDDSDPNIQYAGGASSWTTDTTGLNGIGSYGPIYNGTSHGVAAVLSVQYDFNGTAISAFGTNQQTLYPNNTYLPFFECLVDEVSYNQTAPVFTPENNWNLCNAFNLSANTTHTFTIRVESFALNQTWWLDYLRYTPLPDKSFSSGETAEIYVRSNDAGIEYGGAWETISGLNSVDDASSTQMPQANMTLTFVGTKVAWYGWILNGSYPPSTGSYTIDGSAPTFFDLSNTSAAVVHPNNLFFTTSDMSFDVHDLVVTYEGGSGDHPMPLSLGYLIITGTSVTSSNITVTTLTTTSLTTSSSTTSSSIASQSTSPSPVTHTVQHDDLVGTIIGSILGGLCGIALGLSISRWWKRRRIMSRDLQPSVDNGTIAPFVSRHVSSTAPRKGEVLPPYEHPMTDSSAGQSASVESQMTLPVVGQASHSKGRGYRQSGWAAPSDQVPHAEVQKHRLDT
ncbi:hypothetical protein H0H92_015531 [Tricholoma furcatifolium]|nr:hypothetical protein H0H92_015531 [Tricholoma furcatifolium]